ncbi:MAG TPA: uracil-DNA glycosylase [Ktedonobacteraceae bacterium]|nr:uracil-DNA glycosylase [Ktedonobacteraceae bacterium]
METYKTFSQLVEQVQVCRLCERMEGRRRVLSAANGNLHAKVLFIAEAPGRLGGDRCGIPLAQDQTGRNFALLLQAAGLSREEIFITNAVLCNPRDAGGRNASPSTREIRNCSPHLRKTIEIIAPHTIVSLGQVALKALNLIAPHNIQLAHDVGTIVEWNGYQLIPLYHPGPRAQLHRPFETQVEDFRRLRTLFEKRA